MSAVAVTPEVNDAVVRLVVRAAMRELDPAGAWRVVLLLDHQGRIGLYERDGTTGKYARLRATWDRSQWRTAARWAYYLRRRPGAHVLHSEPSEVA